MNISSVVRGVGCASFLAFGVGCGSDAEWSNADVESVDGLEQLGANLRGPASAGPEASPQHACSKGQGPLRTAQVDFGVCTETASIAALDPALVRDRVPAEYTLAGGGAVALLVVRVADCEDIVIDGASEGPGTVSQIGVTLAAEDGSQGPDATADINNYALWLTTDNGALSRTLRRLGVAVAYDRSLDYAIEWDSASEGHAEITSRLPPQASYTASGPIAAPGPDPTHYVATWWENGRHGTVKMRTDLPSIYFGGATMTLHTSPNTELAEVIDGIETDFVVFDSFNTFDAATLIATVE